MGKELLTLGEEALDDEEEALTLGEEAQGRRLEALIRRQESENQESEALRLGIEALNVDQEIIELDQEPLNQWSAAHDQHSPRQNRGSAALHLEQALLHPFEGLIGRPTPATKLLMPGRGHEGFEVGLALEVLQVVIGLRAGVELPDPHAVPLALAGDLGLGDE